MRNTHTKTPLKGIYKGGDLEFIEKWLKEEEGWKGDSSICYKNCPHGYREEERFDGYIIRTPYCVPDSCIYAPTTELVRLRKFKNPQQWIDGISYDESIEFLEYQPNINSNTDLIMAPSLGWNGSATICVRDCFYIIKQPKTKLLRKNVFDDKFNIIDQKYYVFQGRRNCGEVLKNTSLYYMIEAWLDNPCVQVTHEKRYGKTSRRYITVSWEDLKWMVNVSDFPHDFTYLNERLLNHPRKSMIELSKELEKENTI